MEGLHSEFTQAARSFSFLIKSIFLSYQKLSNFTKAILDLALHIAFFADLKNINFK